MNKPRTVLIVEDDPHNRTFLLDLLVAYGYSTLIATNGEEGYELGLQARPDLILMDLGLPNLDGWSLTRRLKEHPDYCGAPIIALTAWTRVEDEERALNAGCDVYLRKPVGARPLLEVLERCLEEQGTAS